MYDNEKAPSSVLHTLDEAGAETSGTLISDNHFITAPEKKQPSIAAMLPHGEENAIPAKTLAEMVGAPSVRALQARISRECADTGALILSTVRHGGGYFLPGSGASGRDEILRFVGTLTARGKNTFLRLQAARRALRLLDGQLEIENDDTEEHLNG